VVLTDDDVLTDDELGVDDGSAGVVVELMNGGRSELDIVGMGIDGRERLGIEGPPVGVNVGLGIEIDGRGGSVVLTGGSGVRLGTG
jgi:hypothetical protein